MTVVFAFCSWSGGIQCLEAKICDFAIENKIRDENVPACLLIAVPYSLAPVQPQYPLKLYKDFWDREQEKLPTNKKQSTSSFR